MSLLKPSRLPISQEPGAALGKSVEVISGLMGIQPPFRIIASTFAKNPTPIIQKPDFLMLMSEKASKNTNEILKNMDAKGSENRSRVIGRIKTSNWGRNANITNPGAFNSSTR